VTALALLVLVAMLSIRGSAGSKVWDRVAFVTCVAGTAFLAIRFLRKSTVPPSRLASLMSVGGIIWGIARIEHHPMTPPYWEGFGTSVALLSLPLAFLIIPVSTWVGRSRFRSRAVAVPLLALATVDLLSFFRDLSNFSVAANNTFVLNEVLAPAAGRVPGANFIPQYTTLFGWGILPFRHVVGTNALADLAIIMLSCLSILSVVLAVVLGRRCLPKRSLWLALGLIVPLVTVTAIHNAVTSSIGSILQDLPVRMFPAMLYSVIAVESLVALMRHSVRRSSIIALGMLAGLMAWNSQDFGIAVALAYALVLQVAARGSFRKRATILWLYGLAPGLLLYPVGAAVIGHPINFRYFALTARSFSAGFASSPIQIPGPVMFVLPVILGSVAVGGSLLWKIVEQATTTSKALDHAVVTLAFVGTWSTIGFVYYLDRSYASGQLQLFLLPVGVCACALFSLCRSAIASGSDGPGSSVLSPLRHGALWVLPVTVPIVVGFAAILQTPSPSTSLDALEHPPPSIGFLATVPTQNVRVALTYIKSHGGGSVGYFGSSANYLKLSTGVTPRILYDDPSDFQLSPAAHRAGCAYLRKNPTKWLVTVPYVTLYVGPTICHDYRPLQVPGEAPRTVFKLYNSLVKR